MRIPLHIPPTAATPNAAEARAELAYFMAQLNPRGVRKPPKHHKLAGIGSTSLAERRAFEAGIIKSICNGVSDRGREKRNRRRLHRARLVARAASREGG